MASRSAEAVWNGTLQEGSGQMKVASGVVDVPFSFSSRFGDNNAATNPEELLAAANAGCFSMALGNALGGAGYTVHYIKTRAEVEMRRVDEKTTITKMTLHTEGKVDGVDEATFKKFAEDTKSGCIVSRALAGIPEFVVDAKLV